MIQGKLGVPTEELKLVFANQLLEDGCTLSDYNTQDGATLTLGRMDVHNKYTTDQYFTMLVFVMPYPIPICYMS